MTKKTMQKLLSGFLLMVAFQACTPADDPVKSAKAFSEAFASRDFKTAESFATKDSKTLLDLVKTMIELQNDEDFKVPGLDKEFLKEAVFEPAVIEGNRATVKVSARGRSHTIKLLKEEGKWKVALDKDALEETMATPAEVSLPAPDSSGATEGETTPADTAGEN